MGQIGLMDPKATLASRGRGDMGQEGDCEAVDETARTEGQRYYVSQDCKMRAARGLLLWCFVAAGLATHDGRGHARVLKNV